MGQRWSVEQVLALAPDDASRRAAPALAARPWHGTGVLADLVWGLAPGSGSRPYQTAVDLSGPAFRCSCPSRKFPCKHALALLLAWAAGDVPEAAEAADWAAAWRDERAARADRPARRAATGGRDEAAAAKRAAQRADRVAAGLDELELWLRDQVRGGLAGAAGGYGHAEPVAARMVDAQAPGVAGTLRRLSAVPASGDGWPGRLLAGYARLHLLARAYRQLDTLPPALAATVRAHVGFSVRREDVLAEPGITDHWHVLAVREVPDAAIPTRRTWLRGRESGRYALVLAFDPRGEFGGNPDAAFVPGTAVRARLHYYPGRPPLRTAIAERDEAEDAPSPAGALDLAGLLAEWAVVLELDPWLGEWPAVACGVPYAEAGRWLLADATAGTAVPLQVGGTEPEVLAAVSGGAPVVVAGEVSADGLRPLTVWHGDQAVPL